MSIRFLLMKNSSFFSGKRKTKTKFSLDNSINPNKSKRRLDSANTNFTINSKNKMKNKNNFSNQSNSSENNSGNIFFPKKEINNRPNWKYSYYLDKNDIMFLNNPEIKNSLYDFKDIDKRPKPFVYSWTKPKMVKIIENNSLIEEEVKSHFWKYSHIFENDDIKVTGKLLRILMNQLSGDYIGGANFSNFNSLGNDMNFKYNNYLKKQWKFPGIYKNKINRNSYESIRFKRPKSSYK